jgi:UDP-N-acetylglucosamine diphosphorylase/glucosamine-1-phosphate N-acetyltransferase
MNICIFEDETYRKLLPLVHLRPVYDLRCGITTLKEKITRALAGNTFILHMRNYLQETQRERNKGTCVNDIPREVDRLLLINGRLLSVGDFVKECGSEGADRLFVRGNTLIGARLSAGNLENLRKGFGEKLIGLSDFPSIEREEVEDAGLITFPWELVHRNGAQIVSDFQIQTQGKPRISGKVYDGAHLLNPTEIHIAEDAQVKPGAVLDAEDGPIYVAEGVKIMPNAVIKGPAFIGRNSVIRVAGKIYENTTIGEGCKVGGEIEESIIHAHSNKQHEGFIGHSYLGEWVNIGADSNNSDLKNNYGSVKVFVDGLFVDTGSQFVGLVMGDHSKCGINSMFNTGTVVGVCCNLFGAGMPPKFIPAFSWGGAEDGLTTYRLEKAVEVARRVMARRNMTLAACEETLLRNVFEMTMEDRASAGARDETAS